MTPVQTKGRKKCYQFKGSSSGMRFFLNSLLNPLEQAFSSMFSLKINGEREPKEEEYDEYAVAVIIIMSVTMLIVQIGK